MMPDKKAASIREALAYLRMTCGFTVDLLDVLPVAARNAARRLDDGEGDQTTLLAEEIADLIVSKPKKLKQVS